MLRYTVRPISDRTWQRPGEREQSRFTATWSDTLDLLERELRILDATDLVIEVDVRERDIRNDGQLRADARSSSPAVVVAFETRKLGALQYRLDRFERQSWSRSSMDSWQHNVRGIAKTLEALRAVDRYGPTRSTQQYQGYRAIGAGSTPVGGSVSVIEAAEVVARHVGSDRRVMVGMQVHNLTAAAIVEHADTYRVAYRRAARRAHPDTGGSTEAFAQLAAAGAVLAAHHGTDS